MKEVELDKLLCKIDGCITVYRMNNKEVDEYKNDKLIKIQTDIQSLWSINACNKGVVKKPYRYVKEVE